MELLDIYNEKKEITGKIIERIPETKLKDNEYILYVQCWIINDNNEILLSQRNLNKIHGGTWEPTGGIVCSGETSIEGIQRELKEEIGISVGKNELKKIRTITEKKSVNWFRDIYILRKDIKIEDLKFADNEVIDAKYVTIKEFKEMISNKQIMDWLLFFEKEYYKIIS